MKLRFSSIATLTFTLLLSSLPARSQTPVPCEEVAINGLSCGSDATLTDPMGTAIGRRATAAHLSTAVGAISSATGPNSVAVGVFTEASAVWSTAVGYGATSTARGATSLGIGADASAEYAVAIGRNAGASNESTISIGRESSALAAQSIALGAQSRAYGTTATAIGAGSFAQGDNSVAIGAGSTTLPGENDVFSVGNAFATRRITNVSAPLLGSDASTKAYVDTTASTTFLNAVNSALTGSALYTDNRVDNALAAANAYTLTSTQSAFTNAQNYATFVANQAESQAESFATVAADGAVAVARDHADQVGIDSRVYANNLVTGGVTAASLASVDVNGGGITHAGTISGVTAATQSDQAVNFSQLQAVFTQLVQSGLCRIDGANVSCGVTGASNALAAGNNAQVAAGADNAIALGTNSRAQSAGAIALGSGATAVRSNSVAIGAGATALSSVAVGTGAQAIGTNTTALGDNAVASGNLAVAVGNNASATHANSVALGNGSTTNAANTVSVGSAGAERRITNVASGTNGTDAVNVMQLNAAVSAINQSAGNSLAYTDQQVAYARAFAARGIAASSAIPSVSPSAAGKTAVGLGTGYYDGETAVGLSVAHAFTDSLLLSGGMAKVSGGKNVARVAVGFEF